MIRVRRPPRPHGSPVAANRASARARRLRLFWLCLGPSLVAVILLVWLFGLTWWTVLIAALELTWWLFDRMYSA
jgi:Flp pilus assembly protein TadB